jgi:UDP-N-acetyl-2-amino-2-deoxyglucuronate dehydrogenase
MRVGIIGTGAIAEKHAQAYRNIGYEIAVCSNRDAARGRDFAARHRTRFVERWQDVCSDPELDFVDLCTLPDFRLPVVELCAANHKPVQVQKPIAADLATAHRMIQIAKAAGILLGVVSQHRFDDSSQFLKRAIDARHLRDAGQLGAAGRLGRILEADAYIKWFRPPQYYARPAKGTWAGEGGGALINQGIHSVDLLRWMMGPVEYVDAHWQLGALHKIESEDVVNALVRYESGATGVIQASTAFRPGSPERIEIHGTKGTAIIAGDRLVTWDVEQSFENDPENDPRDQPPVQAAGSSGASDPMALSLTPFERQFRDFGDAIKGGHAPLVTGVEGYRALELVDAIYRSCREGRRIGLNGRASNDQGSDGAAHA